MKFKFQALALAAAVFSAGGAHADFNFQNTGDGTLLFIAVDRDANIQFTADLGLTVSSFLGSSTLTSDLRPGQERTWNFATNTTNSGIAGTNAWSTAYDTFKSNQTGENFLWGVIASDSLSPNSAPNPRRNTLSTGNPSATNMLSFTVSQTITDQQAAFLAFENRINNFGNMIAANTNGAAITTSAVNHEGFVYNFGGIQDNFNGANTWSYFLKNGVSSAFQNARQTDNNVRQFGNPITVDSLSVAPITFTFDIATDSLVLAQPIPEPSTYAMLLAGLAAVGFMARRRKV